MGSRATRASRRSASVVGKKVTTIEGLATNGKLTAVQQAWIDEQVPQCGWCQSGQIMMAEALLRDHPKPTDKDMDGAMFQVLCRCGTYPRIKQRHQARVGSGDRLWPSRREGLTLARLEPRARRSRWSTSASCIGAKVKIAKGTKAEAADVSDGLRFGTFYREAGHLANPTTATFEQSADAPTAEQQAAHIRPELLGDHSPRWHHGHRVVPQRTGPGDPDRHHVRDRR